MRSPGGIADKGTPDGSKIAFARLGHCYEPVEAGRFTDGTRMVAAWSRSRPMDPAVIVGRPVSFFTHPARLRCEPANSGSQKRHWEQSKMSTPDAASW
jgi:hypothetical protein